TPRLWSPLLLLLTGAITSFFCRASLFGQSVGTNIQLGADPAALPSSNLAQAEPHIVRSATDSNFLLATFHEGTYALNGGAVDDGHAVSHDGGSTRTRALIPTLTQIPGGPYYRASDPTAAIDLNGNAYLCTIASVGTDFSNGTANILVSKSTNGGSSFAPPIIAYQQPANGAGPDKNWLVVNNFSGTTKANRLFVAFDLPSASSAPIVRTYSDDGG